MGPHKTMHAIHPAYARLRHAARRERRQLCRALAIEADWRYHDGPEWAARYWVAFGDLMHDAHNDEHTSRAREQCSKRLAWRPLDSGQSERARQLFRRLLAVLHPQVMPVAASDRRAADWSKTLRAYRGGDLPALTALWHQTRTSGPAWLPQAVVALRAEHDRLRAAREAADRRLAELSQQFPYTLRDKLDDADWIRRQRLAWRQVLAMSAPPRQRTAAASHRQVS